MSAPSGLVPVKSRAAALFVSGSAGGIALIGFVLWSLAVVAVQYASPILDGDLFWHLKYAEQMIARGTLVPDHTLYSWTQTSNDTIYCTWLSELLLYGLYQAGGLAPLFWFRYLCVAICAALLIAFARARRLPMSLPALAAILVSLLGVLAGTLIKPEIFSLVAFHLLVFACAMGRDADRRGRDPRLWFAAVPMILAIWVNAHGGFIFAVPFLAAVFTGEMLTRRLAPRYALSRRGFGALLLAFTACGVAIFLTPYGWRYPAQLVQDYALHSGPRVGESWNGAYQPILSGGWSGIAEYGLLIAAMLAGLALAAGRRLQRVDWGLLLAALLYVPLYLAFVRTTFYLAVVFGYLALDLLAILNAEGPDPLAAARPAGRFRSWLPYLSKGGAAAVLIAAGAAAIHDARLAEKGSWIGFGISAINPVVEAEFLAASRLGPRLYNVFDAGGYLLWRLDPAYKVMIDPRFFPYKSWFDELYAFSTGERFDAFLEKYPADTAIIDLDRVPLWKNFLQSKEWRLAFYGPTSAIFVARSVADDRLARDLAPDRFDHLRNGRTAFGVFDFALVVGDYATAWTVLGQAQARAYQVDGDTLERALALRDGYRSLAVSDYDAALPGFAAAKARPVQGWREPLIAKLLEERSAARERNDAAAVGRYEAALRELVIPPPP